MLMERKDLLINVRNYLIKWKNKELNQILSHGIYLYFTNSFIKWKRNTMINAYGKQGFIEKAEELFKQMENEGIKPDVKTW